MSAPELHKYCAPLRVSIDCTRSLPKSSTRATMTQPQPGQPYTLQRVTPNGNGSRVSPRGSRVGARMKQRTHRVVVATDNHLVRVREPRQLRIKLPQQLCGAHAPELPVASQDVATVHKHIARWYSRQRHLRMGVTHYHQPDMTRWLRGHSLVRSNRKEAATCYV